MTVDKSRSERIGNELDEDEDEDSQKDKYLTFRISNEAYGIPIYHIIEIVGIQHITEVPDMPNFVKGVINLRGQVIPVMDVRTRFQMEPREYDDRTCVVVTQLEEITVGLVVDTVQEVIDIKEENISPPPKIAQNAHGRYIQGMGKLEENVVIILNVNKLLYDEELESLK